MEGGSSLNPLHHVSTCSVQQQMCPACLIRCWSHALPECLCFTHTFALTCVHTFDHKCVPSLSYRWIQIACPRLSIDWGTAFSKPLLSPYEVNTQSLSKITAHTASCIAHTYTHTHTHTHTHRPSIVRRSMCRTPQGLLVLEMAPTPPPPPPLLLSLYPCL